MGWIVVYASCDRTLFLDARLAATLAPRVGAILLEETGMDAKVDEVIHLTAASSLKKVVDDPEKGWHNCELRLKKYEGSAQMEVTRVV